VSSKGGIDNDAAAQGFASLGSWAERSLHRWTARQARFVFGSDVLSLYNLRVPLKRIKVDEDKVFVVKGDEFDDVPIPCILPWDIIRCIHRSGPAGFRKSFLQASQSRTEVEPKQYWLASQTETFGQLHPITSIDPQHWNDYIPLNWHCDGVQTTQGSGAPCEMIVYSFCSALTNGDCGTTRHLLLSFPQARVVKGEHGTHAAIARHIGWMHRVLFEGRVPSEGARGEDLSGTRDVGTMFSPPYRFAFGGLKHDMAARRQIHGDKRHASCNSICPRCLASKSVAELDYRDMSETASHRLILCDHFLHISSGMPSPWVSVPGWTYCRSFLDGMHVHYHAGFGNDACASCLLELCLSGFFGANVDLEVALYRASCLFREWHKRHQLTQLGAQTRHRFKDLTRARVNYKTAASFPSVAQTFKCGHVKALMYFCQNLLAEKVTARNEHDEVRSLMFYSFISYVEILRTQPAILSPEAREGASVHGSRALLQYQVLHQQSRAQGGTFWRMRPKTHYAYEIVQSLKASPHPYNMKFAECWNDEDLMGKFARLYGRCSSLTAMSRGLQRYGRGLMAKWFRDFGNM